MAKRSNRFKKPGRFFAGQAFKLFGKVSLIGIVIIIANIHQAWLSGLLHFCGYRVAEFYQFAVMRHAAAYIFDKNAV